MSSSDAGDDVASCHRCGRRRADDSPLDALAWVMERDTGRRVLLCPSCARRHVRDIEGKLPTEYW
ncbi:hypothetical protein G1H11_00260 [Phytoactinopolyspora alkaliphila]|uniref:Uncharacterized protein n=1 Tax=Phytoactinopolyspora alkaliphila TaxID=1783498 RepID=A0A6N9YFR3_9ACTN|nr:hypothetical protein [Phytoactinopolyspora alkaliphila]NED93745.1 hypothetical protein [Phytoactinopolyspora alkaliphila]